MFIYSLPYVALILFFAVLAVLEYQYQDKRERCNMIHYIAFATLYVFFGFRGYIGEDWTGYSATFELLTFDKISFNLFVVDEGEHMYEPGICLLMLGCKKVVDSYVFFQMICTSINLLLLFMFLRKRLQNYSLGIILFLAFGGYIMMTNLMRNSISILIMVNAITFIEERKPVQYFICCLTALLFHVSTLLFFPLYFITHFRYNKWILLGLLAMANIVFISHGKFMEKIIELVLGDSEGRLVTMALAYSELDDLAVAKTFSIGYLERLFSITMVFLYYNKLCEIRKANVMFINMFVACLCFVFLLSEFSIMAERLANLLIFSYWILWYDLLRVLSIRNNRILFSSFIVLYSCLKMVGITSLQTAEYDNHLFGAKSWQERIYIQHRHEIKK